jgi:hypothetical protein
MDKQQMGCNFQTVVARQVARLIMGQKCATRINNFKNFTGDYTPEIPPKMRRGRK